MRKVINEENALNNDQIFLSLETSNFHECKSKILKYEVNCLDLINKISVII